MEARDKWTVFLKTKATEFNFRYKWIKDKTFYSWVNDHLDVLDIMDGEETFGVFVVVI